MRKILPFFTLVIEPLIDISLKKVETIFKSLLELDVSTLFESILNLAPVNIFDSEPVLLLVVTTTLLNLPPTPIFRGVLKAVHEPYATSLLTDSTLILIFKQNAFWRYLSIDSVENFFLFFTKSDTY